MPVRLAPGITPEALAPKSAQLLWQTEPNLIADVKLRSNQVYFTLNGEAGGALKEGNAVIAVFSEADGGGDILWSWHIWVTAADLDAAVQTYTLYDNFAAAGPTVLMDRNLGALKAGMWGTNGDNLALGLLYQWGRKDPFLNIDDTDIGGTGALAIGRLRKTYDAAGNALSVDNAAAEYDATNWRYFTAKTIPADRIARYGEFRLPSTSNNWLDEAVTTSGAIRSAARCGETGHKSVYDPSVLPDTACRTVTSARCSLPTERTRRTRTPPTWPAGRDSTRRRPRFRVQAATSTPMAAEAPPIPSAACSSSAAARSCPSVRANMWAPTT